jgi:hypothetical protein
MLMLQIPAEVISFALDKTRPGLGKEKGAHEMQRFRSHKEPSRHLQGCSPASMCPGHMRGQGLKSVHRGGGRGAQARPCDEGQLPSAEEVAKQGCWERQGQNTELSWVSCDDITCLQSSGSLSQGCLAREGSRPLRKDHAQVQI